MAKKRVENRLKELRRGSGKTPRKAKTSSADAATDVLSSGPMYAERADELVGVLVPSSSTTEAAKALMAIGCQLSPKAPKFARSSRTSMTPEQPRKLIMSTYATVEGTMLPRTVQRRAAVVACEKLGGRLPTVREWRALFGECPTPFIDWEWVDGDSFHRTDTVVGGANRGSKSSVTRTSTYDNDVYGYRCVRVDVDAKAPIPEGWTDLSRIEAMRVQQREHERGKLHLVFSGHRRGGTTPGTTPSTTDTSL